MEPPERKAQWIVWGGLALTICGVLALFFLSRANASRLPVLAEVIPFALTNQAGQVLTRDQLQGKVWIADIIFTRCAGPCVRMTKQLAEIQNELPRDGSIQIVSLTADPEFDTPEVLAEYGTRYGARSGQWHFLTGSKTDLYNLALKGLLLAVEENDPANVTSVNDMFIHSTLFVLVDKRGRLRAVFESTEAGVQERILSEARKLLRE